MESLQTLKSRSRAVKNIGQITKAMEVVSATKMRRAQERALSSRPYAYAALALLKRVAAEKIAIPLSDAKEGKRTLVVLVASDRGLAGSFNTQVTRTFEQFLAKDPIINTPGHELSVLAIGKKAKTYAEKKKLNLVESFVGFGDYADPDEIAPAAHLAVEGFKTDRWDRVMAISMHFRTTLSQQPIVRQILPVSMPLIEETIRSIIPEHGRFAELGKQVMGEADERTAGSEYLIEPSPEEVLFSLVPHLVGMQIYHLMLEANASEHSARRVAMKTASDNADEISKNLTLEYNKARQASITKEIIEITSTQSALG